MKRFLGFILILVFKSSLLLASDGSSDAPHRHKKYQVSVCSLFKNEAKYLREWIEYHRIVGVDHFYLYNNGSLDRSVDVLTPYIKEGLVTLVYWPDRLPLDLVDDVSLWALIVQFPAYENAAKFLAFKDTQWLMFLDVDEFIVPVHARSIGDVLGNYRDYPGVQVVSQFYNAFNEDGVLRKKLVVETVELTEEPVQAIEKEVEKLIFNPRLHTTFDWPPFQCRFKDDQPVGKVSKSALRINKYLNRPKSFFYFGKTKDKLCIDHRRLTEQETVLLLKSGVEIEDQERPIYRFLPELLKRMGVETGWGW